MVLQVVGFTVARARRGFREELLDAPCSRLSIVRFARGPKRSMGRLLGSEKNFFFNSRHRRSHHGGRVGGILSIRGPEVSLGSLWVGRGRVQAPTPHTPPLQAYFGQFSQQTKEL